MFRKVAASLAAMGLLLAMAGPALATETLNPDHVGAEWGDFIPDDPEACVDDLKTYNVGEGEVLWHFVLTSPESDSGTLTATFSNIADPVVVTNGEPLEANTLHFWIVTDEDNVLLSASTDTNGGNLNLSHTCYGGPPPEIPEAPFAFILPVVALGALGGYLVINRRKATSLV